ncbi:MAG: amidohydrolase family protein [Alphaproteobacteria bacterium]
MSDSMQVNAPPDPRPRTPAIKAPPGACDTHCHVYGTPGQYELAPTRRYDPADCPLEKHQDMLAALGIERAVLVQASCFGADNTAMLDAVAAMAGRYRGIAVLDPDVAEDELERLHEGGVRGVRMSTLPKSRVGPEHMETMAERIKPFGWLIQLHLDKSDHLVELAERLPKLPVPVLLDHFGRTRGGEGIESAGFRVLLRLLRETENCWGKLCSFYRLSDEGAPLYGDMEAPARALVGACPDRLVWGTNWPHPNHKSAMPNDGDLFDILWGWVEDADIRKAILADNPAKLFGFV